MQQNGRCRLLSPDEEAALGVRAQGGDLNARDDLVAANNGLVTMVVARYRKPPDDDLDAAGMLGLVEAADRFDPEHYPGIRFATYAMHWIRLEVVASLKRRRIVHVPDYLGRPGLPQPVGPAARRRREEQTRCAALARRPHLYLATDSCEEVGDDRAPAPTDPRTPAFERALARAEAREEISAAMFGLTDFQRLVVRRRYGLDDGQHRTLAELGREFNLSKERVRKIEQAALAAMRSHCAAEENASCVA
jgi:RNA polymerase primary sigma factor